MRTSISITSSEYESIKSKYPVYITDEIHVRFVQLFFATLIDHSLHRLDVNFCDPFPHVNRKPNVLFTLMKHLEEPHNKSVISRLQNEFLPTEMEKEKQQPKPQSTPLRHDSELSLIQSIHSTPSFIALIDASDDSNFGSTSSLSNLMPTQFDEQMAQYHDYQRLLRLTVPSLFNPLKYSGGEHIASGAFGAVMKVIVDDESFAVKSLEKSRNEFDNPHLFEVFYRSFNIRNT